MYYNEMPYSLNTLVKAHNIRVLDRVLRGVSTGAILTYTFLMDGALGRVRFSYEDNAPQPTVTLSMYDGDGRMRYDNKLMRYDDSVIARLNARYAQVARKVSYVNTDMLWRVYESLSNLDVRGKLQDLRKEYHYVGVDADDRPNIIVNIGKTYMHNNWVLMDFDNRPSGPVIIPGKLEAKILRQVIANAYVRQSSGK